MAQSFIYFFFFFNDTATTEIYTLSLHDALPILLQTLATGLMLGAFAAITRLGPHPFSLRGVVPILTAGAVFGMVGAAARRSFGRTSTRLSYAVLAIAGAAGGIGWGVVPTPPSARLL